MKPMDGAGTEPVSLGSVLKAELGLIKQMRKKRIDHGVKFEQGHKRDCTNASVAAAASQAKPAWQTRDTEWVSTIADAHNANLTALAFSGGGIRSATFNLGVLQALADLNLLSRIDYLSTVSGGGYIGGWLAAWVKQVGSFAEVQKQLATKRVQLEEDQEPPQVRFLRVFSNYLTPKLGIFSGDTWAMVSIYLRNLLLNQTIVLGMVMTLLLAPYAVQKCASAALARSGAGYGWILAIAICLWFGFVMMLINTESVDAQHNDRVRQFGEQVWILLFVVLPLFVAAALLALWLGPKVGGDKTSPQLSYGITALAAALAYCVLWFLATLGGKAYRKWVAEWVSKAADNIADLRGRKKQQPGAALQPANVQGGAAPARRVDPPLMRVIALVGAGALAGALYAVLSRHAVRWQTTEALTVGVPLLVGILLLTGALHIGLAGIEFHDWKRECWGRLGGWLLLLGIAWLVIFWVALCFPDFIRSNLLIKATWKFIAAKYLTPAWILTTVGSVLAGKSKASGKPEARTWLGVVAKVGPYVFIAGLLCWVSYGIAVIRTLPLWSEARPNAGVGRVFHSGWPGLDVLAAWFLAVVGHLATWMLGHALLCALVVCIGITALMAWRVDVNQFSMHLFYRNRLVRCYLGASNPNRSPNRFTGFDPNDDVPLKNLRPDTATKPYDGPYPILNASLNLVKGKDLAWQERKAESFVMTPCYCGYDVWLEEQDSPMLMRERPLTDQELSDQDKEIAPRKGRRWLRTLDRFGYRETKDYAFPPPFHGPNLGLAMAISGAAASPNMGFYSSTPVAFLMTVFNVRLGQWLGNPRHRRTWKRATPVMGLPYLLNELFAGTTDEAAYVYLSDGGHFDNMGLYELVKRRCGLIIVCDAEADDKYEYRGLAGAIRKCRIDMGIDINLDLTDLTPSEVGKPSKKHCAIGTIHYENADIEAPTGTIIYIKASMTGDEPSDVQNYKKTCGAFPHESTVDQWFSESQFESYRTLGYHEVVSSIKGALPTSPQPTVPGWWSTAAAAVSEALSRLAGGAPHQKNQAAEPPTLAKELSDVFERFGFAVDSHLAPSGRSEQSRSDLNGGKS